jgi:hypothetical protein
MKQAETCEAYARVYQQPGRPRRAIERAVTAPKGSPASFAACAPQL